MRTPEKAPDAYAAALPDVTERMRTADMGPRALAYAENIHRQIQDVYDAFGVKDFATLTAALQRDPRRALTARPLIDQLPKLYAALQAALQSAEKVERVLTEREKLAAYVAFTKRAVGLQEWRQEILESTRALHALVPMSQEEIQAQIDRVVAIAEDRADISQAVRDYFDVMHTAHAVGMDADEYLQKALQHIPELFSMQQREESYAAAAMHAAECELPYGDLLKKLRRKGKDGPPFSSDIAHNVARIGTVVKDERLIDEAVSCMELTDDAVEAFTTTLSPSAARKLANKITDPVMRARGLALAALSSRDIPREDVLHIFERAEAAVTRIADQKKRLKTAAYVAFEKGNFLDWEKEAARPKAAYGEQRLPQIADLDAALKNARKEKNANHSMNAFRDIIRVMIAQKKDPTPVLTAASRKFKYTYAFWSAELAGIYASIGKFNHAKRIVAHLHGGYRVDALARIDFALLRNGASPDTVFTDQLIVEARALLREERSDYVLDTIACLMADAGLLDRAQVLAASIPDEAQRRMALGHVAVCRVQHGDVTGAFQLLEQYGLRAKGVADVLLHDVERLKDVVEKESAELVLV